MGIGPGTAGDDGTRPAVSVVMPFRGDNEAAVRAARALAALRTHPNDELVIVDNGSEANVAEAFASELDQGAVVVEAGEIASSYYARNVGAERASSPWLLFLDADCQPSTELLDEYFRVPPAPDVGAVAGEVLPTDDGSLLGGWAVSRGVLRQSTTSEHPHRPAAVTANLLVRRDTWRRVGGFLEGVRSGGDVDFCWRIQDDGWSLEYRSEASVRHPPRRRLAELARQMARYGAGNAWLNRRYPGSHRPAAFAGVLRGLAGTIAWLVALRPRRAAYKAIDTLAIGAHRIGFLMSNTIAVTPRRTGGIVVMTDCYARHTETFVSNEVRQLVAAGQTVRVESITRPQRQLIGAGRIAPVAYVEDEGTLARLRSLIWLLARHPFAALRDAVDRNAWDSGDRVSVFAIALVARRLARGGERHIHVHFATASAVTARRLERIRNVPYSVTAHGFEIWVDPRNLREKLTPAAFVTSGCAYNVDYLREVLGSSAASRIHEIVMGVDTDRFKRRVAYEASGTVAAVGRLVEKKGFRYLIEAAAEIDDRVLQRVLIVGDGPLRHDLEELVRGLGLGDRLEFLGNMGAEDVRRTLERADLLAMPCVIGADGDRDSMPVVVKEALAMEIPVIASDEVGLPEAVGDDRGRLVAPADSMSLAEAIDELLRLPAAERAAMGRAGRDWVLQNATLNQQAAKLLELLDSAQGGADLPFNYAGAPTSRDGRTGGSARVG